MLQRLFIVAAALLAMFLCGLVRAADEALLRLDGGTRVNTTDARVEHLPDALRISTGHEQPWPGITLPAPAPGSHWDLSRRQYIAVTLKNLSAEPIKLHCRIDNPGADGQQHCQTESIDLDPGAAGTLRINFDRKAAVTAGRPLFGMRGLPPGFGDGKLDPANITQIILFLDHPKADRRWELSGLAAGGEFSPPATAPGGREFFPFIDSFGQYIHRDWPGKTHNLDELAKRREEEQRELAANPAPEDWDQWGGWKTGPKLASSGFFRAEKHEGRWWLVDPDGRLFFSHGIDCIRLSAPTPIEERDAWFAEPPGRDPALRAFRHPAERCIMGHYAGRQPLCFDFLGANLARKYGPDWRTLAGQMAHTRLRSWALNTIGNWSDPAIYRMHKTPYTATLAVGGRDIEGSEGYWGRFPDPFAPDFTAALRRSLEQNAPAVNDPWCIGFFVDNERPWGNDTSLAVAALTSPADQPAKITFLDDLKTRYGTIEKLNAAWGTTHISWQALLDSHDKPDSARAADDLRRFYTRIADQYFSCIRATLRQAAPKQLYLGCRLAWSNRLVEAAAARHCDVVSFNRYQRSVAALRIEGADVPIMIGEFHFGALDRGLFHPGLVPAADQAERARLYQQYIRSVLQNPAMVGCHWFEYYDQPAIGRALDGENYQIGFLDVADTPYRETTDAAREIGRQLYRLRAAPAAK